MKIESRGKYPGVKIHLEPDECEVLLEAIKPGTKTFDFVVPIGVKMGKKIHELLQEEPTLLKERTKEQVKAILAKEVEKAKMQLAQVNQGLSHAKVDKEALKQALLKHAE